MLSVVLGDAIGVGVLDAILTGRVIAAGNFPDQPATISSSTPTSTSKPCATVNTSAPAASPTYSLGNTPALTSTMALKNPSHPTTPKSASASPNTSSAIPFRSKKITRNATTQTVIYRFKPHHTTKRNFEIFKATDFIAAVIDHLPPKGKQTVRYYGLYSNNARGQTSLIPSASSAHRNLPPISNCQFKIPNRKFSPSRHP